MPRGKKSRKASLAATPGAVPGTVCPPPFVGNAGRPSPNDENDLEMVSPKAKQEAAPAVAAKAVEDGTTKESDPLMNYKEEDLIPLFHNKNYAAWGFTLGRLGLQLPEQNLKELCTGKDVEGLSKTLMMHERGLKHSGISIIQTTVSGKEITTEKNYVPRRMRKRKQLAPTLIVDISSKEQFNKMAMAGFDSSGKTLYRFLAVLDSAGYSGTTIFCDWVPSIPQAVEKDMFYKSVHWPKDNIRNVVQYLKTQIGKEMSIVAAGAVTREAKSEMFDTPSLTFKILPESESFALLCGTPGRFSGSKRIKVAMI